MNIENLNFLLARRLEKSTVFNKDGRSAYNYSKNNHCRFD